MPKRTSSSDTPAGKVLSSEKSRSSRAMTDKGEPRAGQPAAAARAPTVAQPAFPAAVESAPAKPAPVKRATTAKKAAALHQPQGAVTTMAAQVLAGDTQLATDPARPSTPMRRGSAKPVAPSTEPSAPEPRDLTEVQKISAHELLDSVYKLHPAKKAAAAASSDDSSSSDSIDRTGLAARKSIWVENEVSILKFALFTLHFFFYFMIT